jgi:phage baseplate assembly protein V
MSLWNLLRRVRIRNLREGLVQTGHVIGFDEDARDDAERFQDYGFAANPVDGEGLRLEVGGHTIIVRMDRIADRPQLAAHEVCVWHKDGHSVTLRAGRVVDVVCDQLNIAASAGVTITTPTLEVVGDQSVSGKATAQSVVGQSDVSIGTNSLKAHDHGNVANGTGRSAPFGS